MLEQNTVGFDIYIYCNIYIYIYITITRSQI